MIEPTEKEITHNNVVSTVPRHMPVMPWITLTELCEEVGRKPDTVRKDLRDGFVPYWRITDRGPYRIPMAAVKGYKDLLEGRNPHGATGRGRRRPPPKEGELFTFRSRKYVVITADHTGFVAALEDGHA